MGLVKLIKNETKSALKNITGLISELAAGREFGIKNIIYEKGVEKNPLILLHGYMQNSGALTTLEKMLKQEGFKQIYRINYDFFRKIEDTSRYLDKQARKILDATKNTKVDVVGHSMGGLLAFYFSLKYSEEVDKCIMLGSPNHGSWPAALGCIMQFAKPLSILGVNINGDTALEMTPYSSFQKKLKKFSRKDGVKRYSIYTPYDIAILKPNSEKVSNAENINTEVLGARDVGHASLIYDPKIVKHIVKILKNG